MAETLRSTGWPLSELGLPAPLLTRLLDADFTTTEDVKGLKPLELSAATSLSARESGEVLRLVTATQDRLQPLDVLQMLQAESEVAHIVTFCEALDTMLGGGVPLQAITEVSGTPGIGKTQMCLQACVSVQLPKSVGGVGGEAIFVDTEGSFTVGRLKDMASHAVHHVQSISGKNEEVSTFTVESILKGTHYFRCHNYIEVLAVIKHIPKLVETHPRIHLVVIDSIAFHFRYDMPDTRTRTSLLFTMTQELIQQAMNYNMAVMVTNQMTTHVEQEGSSELVTALGETWGHCPTLRLNFNWAGPTRVATLTKAPHRRNSSVNFQVTVGGLRDCPVGQGDAPRDCDLPETKKRKLMDTIS